VKCARRCVLRRSHLYGSSDFQQQARTILDRAAVFIGTLVCAIFQELFQQITIRTVDFDSVKPGGNGIGSCFSEIVDDPFISSTSSARGSETSAKPLFTKVFVSARIADGATGAAPPGCKSTCEIRPTCHSCTNMRPPLACTASVTLRQPSI
jgi:hypothetical protein